MATPDDWTKVGHNGNPVSGNPDFLDGIARDLGELRDLASDVDAGLDAMLRTSEDGGFEGRTADALRTYIKTELKTFTANVTTSFEDASWAVTRYANALRNSRGRAEDAANRAGQVEVPPRLSWGRTPRPAELTAARNDVSAEVDAMTAAGKVLEDALRAAAELVSRPVKPPRRASGRSSSRSSGRPSRSSRWCWRSPPSSSRDPWAWSPSVWARFSS